MIKKKSGGKGGKSSTPQNVVDTEMDETKKEMLLQSFVGDSSSKVEIVFSFDTTGSMAPCLGKVREKVTETVTRLIKDIKDIRIGIIAHGDYCDDVNTYAIKTLDLTSKVKKIREFVTNVSATGGGDAPEAYELALREAYNFSWSEDSSKALVIIGDEVPHPPSFTDQKINWFDCLDRLTERNIKVYGIRALNSNHSIPFYEELSIRSGTVSIHFNNLNLIVDMFLAICYREAHPQQLENFKEEVKKKMKNDRRND